MTDPELSLPPVTPVPPTGHLQIQRSSSWSPLSHPSPLRNDGSHSTCDISVPQRNPALLMLRGKPTLKHDLTLRDGTRPRPHDPLQPQDRPLAPGTVGRNKSLPKPA